MKDPFEEYLEYENQLLLRGSLIKEAIRARNYQEANRIFNEIYEEEFRRHQILFKMLKTVGDSSKLKDNHKQRIFDSFKKGLEERARMLDRIIEVQQSLIPQ